MVAETRVVPSQLILPLFLVEGEGIRKPISSMPGHAQISVDVALQEAQEAEQLGIGGLLLFGIPKHKDEFASGAYDEQGIVQKALRTLRPKVKNLLLITDVCNCEYTSHGHCGFIKDGDVDNDISLEWLAKSAVSHARAGADMVAPSDMMDGRVRAIRQALDAESFSQISIMSYAAKYASSFYGPFREAAESAPQFGDRKTYQMDPSNAREAMREMQLDLEEGADILMVKPALAYLDILQVARQRFDVPLAAYQVSGEFSMIEAAAANGWIDRERMIHETLTSIRRAGADIVITYFAKDFAKLFG
jgi:porphobilinogen synthase